MPQVKQTQSGLIELRLPKGLTARELIDCGMARRTAYRVLNSPSRIDLNTLTILCRALGAQPKELLALPGDIARL